MPAPKLHHDQQPHERTVIHYPAQQAPAAPIVRDALYSMKYIAEVYCNGAKEKHLRAKYLNTGIWKGREVNQGEWLVYGGSIIDWVMNGEDETAKPVKKQKR